MYTSGSDILNYANLMSLFCKKITETFMFVCIIQFNIKQKAIY